MANGRRHEKATACIQVKTGEGEAQGEAQGPPPQGWRKSFWIIQKMCVRISAFLIITY
jgi:hypothetical protein